MLDKNLFALPGARRMLGALCLLTLLKAAAIVGQAWALATAVDLLRAGSSVADAAFALAGFFACFMSRQAVVFFQDGMLERYAGDRVAELRSGMLGRVFAEGPLFVGALGTGNAVTLALEGAEQVENYLRLVLPKIAGVVIVPLVLLAFAFPFDWVSGLIMLIVFPFIIFYMVLLGKTAKAEADKQHDEFNRLANHFVDTLRGIDTLKLFGRGAAQGESVFAASERLRTATMKTLRTAILSGAVLDLFATFSVAAVAIMLGFRLVDGSIAFFPALLMLILVPEYFKPIREYASDYHASLDGKTALAALLRVADAPSDALDSPALRPAGPSGEPSEGSATRRSAAQPSASCASLLQSDEYIDGVQTVSAPSDGSPLGTNINPEKRQSVAPLVPPACQPAELADAAVFSGTAPRGDDEGSRTEVRFASAIPAIRGTGEALADVTNDMDVDSLPVWSRASVLEARDVAFDYVDHRALSGVSFSVGGFSKVAIVGMSGSGKSALANLLGGFAEPSEGGFLSSWEGEEPRAFDLASDAWRRQVVYIPQDPYIFHATLRENIAFYRPDADDAAIEGAVEAMGLGELVRQLPQGLDTPIGEGARALSGGQAQRIALARAFLDPQRRILIFDEPTAHLDIETELELKERMLPLMEGRLVFFATHRLHWIHDMDAVMVVDGGRLAEFGAPEELLSRGGALARLAEHMLGGAR